MARGSPTMSTSGLVPVRSGTRPRAGSFMHSFASSVRMRRSQASASWNPAPIACPCTAAIDTMPGSRSQRNPSWHAAIHVSNSGSAALGAEPSPGTPSAENIRRSIPAENDGPAPRTTTTRTRGGRSEPIAASPRHTAGVIALRRSGLLSVTVATASVTSKRSPLASSWVGLMVTTCSQRYPRAVTARAEPTRPGGGPGGGPAAASGMDGGLPWLSACPYRG